MGMFRPESDEAKEYDLGKEGEKIVRKVIIKRYKELGPISQQEIQVALLFGISVTLYILNSALARGWALSWPNIIMENATFSMLIVVALFALPANWNWLRFFNGNSKKFPKKRTHSLITWKYINRKLPWSIFFLLGSGFALSMGGEESGLFRLMGEHCKDASGLPPLLLLFLICFFIQIITEFVSSIAIVNGIFLKIIFFF